MLKKSLSIAIIAFAMMVTFGWSNVHAAPKPQAPAIDCQSTHWVTMVANGPHTFADGITEYSKVQALRDVNSNSYCGQIRAANQVWEHSGVCESFDANLYQNGAIYINGTRQKPACGTQGFTIVAPGVAKASGTFYTVANVFNGSTTFDFLNSPLWTIN